MFSAFFHKQDHHNKKETHKDIQKKEVHQAHTHQAHHQAHQGHHGHHRLKREANRMVRMDAEYFSCARATRRGYDHKISAHERSTVVNHPAGAEVNTFGGEYKWGKTTGYQIRGDDMAMGHYHIVDPIQCTGTYTPFKVEKNLNLAFPHPAEVIQYNAGNASEPPWRRSLATKNSVQNHGSKGSKFKSRSSVRNSGRGSVGRASARASGRASAAMRPTALSMDSSPQSGLDDGFAKNVPAAAAQKAAVATPGESAKQPYAAVPNAAGGAKSGKNSVHVLSPNSAPMASLPNSVSSLNGHKTPAAAAADGSCGTRGHHMKVEDPSHGNPNAGVCVAEHINDAAVNTPTKMKSGWKNTQSYARKIPTAHERFGHE